MSLKHVILLTLALVSLVHAGGCPNEQRPPSGLLPKLRSMYKFGMQAYGTDAYVFWTPNVQSSTVDLALVVRGASKNGPGPLCGWAALGFNPRGLGMIGTTAVRAFWNGTSFTQDQVFAPGYVAVTVPSQFTGGFATTDVYAPLGNQWLISRFTMGFPNLSNTTYAIFTLAARQVDTQLEFHDMFMTQTTPLILFGLTSEGKPLGNTDYCDPNQCQKPRGMCVAPFTCACYEGWTGSQCNQQDLGLYAFIKRESPLDPRSPLKTISRFNQQQQVVSFREIASASPSCSDPAFTSAFLSGGNARILHSGQVDFLVQNGNKFGFIQTTYDTSFAMAPTYKIQCSAVTDLGGVSIIASSQKGIFSVADPSKPISSFNYHEISWGIVSKQPWSVGLTAPLDLQQPFLMAGAYAKCGLLTQTSIQLAGRTYDGTQPVMRSWNLPAGAGAFNLSCIVASELRDDGLWLVQSCESVPVPKIWFIGIDKNSAEASVKLIGTLGCPTGNTFDGPTLLRPEMVSIYAYYSFRFDAVTNCQVGSQVGPVRLVFAQTSEGSQNSFAQPLALNVARSVNDLAGFNMFY